MTSTTNEQWEICVCADTNDGDYVYSSEVLDNDGLKKALDLFAKIKKKFPQNYNNWAKDEIGNAKDLYPDWPEEDIEFINDITPRGEYGIHTIVSVEYYPLPQKVSVLWSR